MELELVMPTIACVFSWVALLMLLPLWMRYVRMGRSVAAKMRAVFPARHARLASALGAWRGWASAWPQGACGLFIVVVLWVVWLAMFAGDPYWSQSADGPWQLGVFNAAVALAAAAHALLLGYPLSRIAALARGFVGLRLADDQKARDFLRAEVAPDCAIFTYPALSRRYARNVSSALADPNGMSMRAALRFLRAAGRLTTSLTAPYFCLHWDAVRGIVAPAPEQLRDRNAKPVFEPVTPAASATPPAQLPGAIAFPGISAVSFDPNVGFVLRGGGGRLAPEELYALFASFCDALQPA